MLFNLIQATITII